MSLVFIKCSHKLNRALHLCKNYHYPTVINHAVGGAPTSAHRFGNAADIQAVGLSIKQLAYDIFEFIQSGKLPKLDQLIREMPRHGGQWVHIGLKNHNGAVRCGAQSNSIV